MIDIQPKDYEPAPQPPTNLSPNAGVGKETSPASVNFEEYMHRLYVEVLHELRQDHGHTTANEKQMCRTCTRRAGIILYTAEKEWMDMEAGM